MTSIVRRVFVWIFAQRKYIKQFFVKDKGVAVIANNCGGAAICGDFHLRYNSPTVNLQIAATEFPEFCKDITFYLQQELQECVTLNAYQKELVKQIYGGEGGCEFSGGSSRRYYSLLSALQNL